MGFFSFLGVMSPAHISLFTATKRGKKIGKDNTGNIYYEADPIKGYNRSRRWVIYNGAADASKVPPEWHGWLHHQCNEVPNVNSEHRKPWQKPHQANMSGTNLAYRPSGHELAKGSRDKVSSDYEAWKPPQ